MVFLFQDISGNQLKDISPLNSLTHLLTLKADRNALFSAKLDEVSASANFLVRLCEINLPVALISCVNYQIYFSISCCFVYLQLPYLQIASFANNKVMDTEGINHPLLEQLNLSCK